MNPLTQHLTSRTANPVLDQLLATEKSASEDWYINQSELEGQGVFAGREFEVDDPIGVAMTEGSKDEFDAKIWNLTPLSRYCNHQKNSNVEIRKVGDKFNLVATKPLQQDDELVADYYQVTRAIGPNSRMQWQGEDVPKDDIEEYSEREVANEDS